MKLRFAVIGTGFWANYQIPAWLELPKVQLVALCDIEKDKAQALADLYGIARVYDQVEEMLASEELDFVDIITGVDTHATFTELAAKKGIGVICQKPMAPTLHKAKMMVEVCRKWNVPFAVHENFRWQRPLRQLKEFLDNEVIGSIFKARVTFCSGFPVFDNQPFLKKLDKFILMDVGSHILDVCRFLFGEVENLLCHTRTVNPEINGEDVANVLLKMKNGISCFAEMSYASILERESFPQTLVLVEGEKGSLLLDHDYQIKMTTKEGAKTVQADPGIYTWADPDYRLVHTSIVACNQNLLHSLQGKVTAETSGEDNLKTFKLIHACYRSSKNKELVYPNSL